MIIERGVVVCSLAGHDKNRFYCVVELRDGGKALIADGRMRKLEKPKLKNLKHLGATTTILDLETVKTNKSLHAALRKFQPEMGEKSKRGRE